MKRLGLLVSACVVALACAEGALRLLGALRPNFIMEPMGSLWWERRFVALYGDGGFTLNAGLHVPHPTRGWTPRPKAHLTLEGKTYTTNDRGQRALRDFRHDPKRFAVMVLGDSYSFGTEADDRDVWPTLLQDLDPRLDVVNLAVGGYGLDQMFLTLRESLPEYGPALVVFAYTGDDLTRSMLSFRDYRKPRFVLRDGRLVLTNTPIGTPAETMRMLQEEYRLPHLLAWRVTRDASERHRARGWEELSRLNTHILEEVVDSCRTRGSDFLLAHLSAGEAMQDARAPDKGERFLSEFTTSHRVHFLATRGHFLSAGHRWAQGHYQGPEASLVARLVYGAIQSTDAWKRFVAAPAGARVPPR